MGKVEERLASLGYQRLQRNNLERSLWVKGENTVRVVHSSEFKIKYVKSIYVRVLWREEWKDDHAVVYDYSEGEGPVCIVPIIELFKSDFVEKKRRKDSYANSGYWWSQKFPVHHELATLVHNFRDRWDLLK